MTFIPFKTFEAVGNREDLSNDISNISPLDTPIFAALMKTSMAATYTEWQTDTLSAPSKNAVVEGHSYSTSALTPTVRLGNYAQEMEQAFTVSDIQEAVDSAGRVSEYAYQEAKAMKQLAIDIEYNIVNGTGNSGGTGTARELKGIAAWITTNVVTGTGTGSEALTKSMVDEALRKAYEKGGNIDMIVLSPFQQSKINEFTGITRNLDATTGLYTDAIMTYASSYGTHRIVMDRNFGLTDTVLLLDSSTWKIATLIPTKTVDVAKTSSARTGVVSTALTVIASNEKANAKITQLTTS